MRDSEIERMMDVVDKKPNQLTGTQDPRDTARITCAKPFLDMITYPVD